MNKIKSWIKKLTCSHFSSDLVRWHWTHGETAMELGTVEIEYMCRNCGKTIYVHLNRKDSFEWEKFMGHYKQDGYEAFEVAQ